MAKSNRFPVTDLDFEQIKTGLKEYLKGQEQFKDYDYEGSNMNVLLDILSYNTFQNNFYNNMAISEMFLDSAQVKESVVSHAKELNYLPRSRTSARAVVDVSLNTFGDPPFVIMPAKTTFRAVCGNKTYIFYNQESITINPVNGFYNVREVDIYEGIYITEQFTPGDTDNGRYLISNKNIDTNSIRVYVTEGDDTEEYMYSSDLYGITDDDRVFFLQPYVGDKYELFFGRDVFGVEPSPGSLIKVEYRVTNGIEGNGITTFEIPEPIQGYQANVTLRTASRGGAEREDLKSIKYFAPKSIQVQDRAVTEKDFEILLKRRYPEIRTVAVYGGETLNPPQYGRVVASVALQDFSNINTNTKQRYRTFLKERCAFTIEPIVVSASFSYYDIYSRVYYNTKNTSKSRADILGLTQAAVMDYSDENLGDFKKTLRLSKLKAMIDEADDNILSNETFVRMILEIQPTPSVPENYILKFDNQLIIQRDQSELTFSGQSIDTAIISSTFNYRGKSVYLKDNGQGTLDIVQNTGADLKVIEKDIGTVNYATGAVGLDGFTVDSFVGPKIKFYATTYSNNIKTPKEHVSFIRSEDVQIVVTGVQNG